MLPPPVPEGGGSIPIDFCRFHPTIFFKLAYFCAVCMQNDVPIAENLSFSCFDHPKLRYELKPRFYRAIARNWKKLVNRTTLYKQDICINYRQIERFRDISNYCSSYVRGKSVKTAIFGHFVQFHVKTT